MDDSQTADVAPNQIAGEAGFEETSAPYVSRWNKLVSTTNWEKGRIITQWRETIAKDDASPTDYSDEAWRRLVGGVSSQHVGRLRRAHQRFGSVYQQYDGLYWSHFQTALDWDDAEMWLEGAIQNGWSVSRMRWRRRETLREAAEQATRDEEIDAEGLEGLDGDCESSLPQDAEALTIDDQLAEVLAPSPAPADDGKASGESRQGSTADAAAQEETAVFVRPFENLAGLPDDLSDALEAFKLAILRHKAEEWRQISCEDILASLEALKQLALAPAE